MTGHKTKYEIGQRVFYLNVPRYLDLSILKQQDIKEATISQVAIKKDSNSDGEYILYYFGTTDKVTRENFIDVDRTALYRKFWKQVIQHKEEEILEIRKDLLKEVVS